MSVQPEHQTNLFPAEGKGAASAGFQDATGIQSIWRALARWLEASAFSPAWMPGSLAHPLAGYLFAIGSQFVALLGTWALVQVLPGFTFPAAVAFLAITFTALGWGLGPGLLSTIVGALLVNYLLLPPHFSWSVKGADLVGCALVCLVGGLISRLASQSEAGRLRAERLLQSLVLEQAQLGAIFESMTDAVLVYDTTGQIVQTNTAATRLFGLTSAPDCLKRSLEEQMTASPPRDTQGRPLPQEQWHLPHLLSGEVLVGETAVDLLITTLEGQEVLVNLTGAPLRNKRGEITGAVAVLRDVTTLRRLERETAERASELEAVFEAVIDGLVVFSAQGKLLRMNPAARQILGLDHVDPGYTLERASPDASRFLVRTEQGQPLTQNHWPISRLLRGETLTGPSAVDLILRSLSEQEIQVMVTGAPIRDQHEQIRGAVSVFHDVTERRRLERRTREVLTALLAMAETLVQAPPAQPFQDSPMQVSNRAVQRLVELTRSVLNCKRVSIAGIEPGTEYQRPVAAIGLSPEEEQLWWHEQRKHRLSDSLDPLVPPRLRAGEVIVFDFTKPPYSERPNPYQVKTMLAAPMRVGEHLVGLLGLDYGEEVHTFTSDELALAGAVAQLGALVLEQERLLRERAEAEAKAFALEEANQRLETFISIVSHELRTPVTSLKANLQLVVRRVQQARDSKNASERLAQPLELLERMEQQMRRLTRLLEDVIDLARIRTGKLDIGMESCDLGALLVEGVRTLQASNAERTISIAPLPAQEALVLADADRVGQVISNYLTNALKYSPAEAPVEVGLTIDGAQVQVWVRDQGPGIPEEEQSRIWELFHRVPGIEVQRGSVIGLGLGLHISKTLIERQGGQVGVESIPGVGSTFWFTLPLLPAKMNSLPAN